ncbi:bifunctional diguanylate cyclase/phosphodiesterase [Phaeobacter sp. B1627]|uniref:putative bifunctional diguanylate cyclase/phosphodiesterase n=1 Tax=Phaeobacter sp. B1627 TaxID=2583809 RepID=UPI001118A1F8|nr:EAL domain-containing protein [Phaeobacter sp. B1627]TNJ41224.1 EAL domain-containing protein [Phaeobacter sp. B1627]
MRLGQTLALFALILAILTGISFLGYRYLTLAGEYRARTMVHFTTTNEVLAILAENPVVRPATAAKLSSLIHNADVQVHWCIENLSRVERRMMVAIGAAGALDLCEQAIHETHRSLNILAPLLRQDAVQGIGDDSPFARNLALAQSVSRLQDLGRDVHPHLNILEARLIRLVQIGTATASLCLAVVFVFLSKQLLHAWRNQADQTLQLKRMSQRAAAAMKAANDGFAIFDENGRLVTCNARYRALSHSRPEQVRPGMTVEQLLISAVEAGHYALNGQAGKDYVAEYSDRVAEHNYRVETQLELSGDRHIISRVNETDFGDKVVTRSDITSLVRAERDQRLTAEALQEAKDRVELQSLRDPLTQLPNRRHLDRELTRRLNTEMVTLVRIDLDRFKKINDILGHEAGDFVLCHVADVLRDHTKEGDLPARVGGDEFVVLCQSGTTLRDGEVLAHRILKAVLEPIAWGNKRCNFGASFGVASGEPGVADASELLSNADAALYRAKASGRAAVEVFTSEMREEALAERALADRLPHALDAGEIVPYYHTQHHAEGGALAGVEVLARWKHPELGVLLPVKFLGIAKQLGLEAELDGHIFETAVQQMNALSAQAITVPRVAFNVSAPRIMEPGFLETVRARIPRNRDRFAFEILESISCEEEGEALIFCIDALKDMGFRIDVDDFGSGHASINAVLNIQPDAIKIDRNIIFPLGQSDRAERMVASVVDLAHTLDVKIIAEGVDTLGKAELLQRFGCDVLQGFYFSEPCSFEALRARLMEAGVDRSAV